MKFVFQLFINNRFQNRRINSVVFVLEEYFEGQRSTIRKNYEQMLDQAWVYVDLLPETDTYKNSGYHKNAHVL